MRKSKTIVIDSRRERHQLKIQEPTEMVGVTGRLLVNKKYEREEGEILKARCGYIKRTLEIVYHNLQISTRV